MVLRFRDSLTGRVAPMEPPERRPLTMYVCGPTVYDASHVGHGRTYLYFDVVRRVLEDRGVEVRVVRNITDYEDKVSWRADALGLSWRVLARREEERFQRDLTALRIRPVDRAPRASEFVPRMIEVGRRLERTGRVERRGDTYVYLPPPPSGRNFPEGDDFEAHRVPEPVGVPTPHPEEGREIVVWHCQRSPLAVWSSPWGRGAPGWHLECYAMAERYLGIPVDLHGGGLDLIFPHHYAENEIALALNGTLFARRFLHLGFVTQLHRKMSKSRGNLVALGSAIARYGPDALRYYLLGTPYYQRLEWDGRAAERAAAEWEEIRHRLAELVAPGVGGTPLVKHLHGLADRVRDRLEDGLGVDRAFGEVREFASRIGAAGSAHLGRGEAGRGRRVLRRLESLLGVRVLGPAGAAGATGRGGRGSG